MCSSSNKVLIANCLVIGFVCKIVHLIFRLICFKNFTFPLQMPLISELNVDQLKLPLGFIKIPQLLLAVIAFTARSGWNFGVKFKCPDGRPIAKTIESFT